MCVCVTFVRDEFEYQKKKPQKKDFFSQTNVAYHTQTHANVRIRPPNWMYANIRNYGEHTVSMLSFSFCIVVSKKQDNFSLVKPQFWEQKAPLQISN